MANSYFLQRFALGRNKSFLRFLGLLLVLLFAGSGVTWGQTTASSTWALTTDASYSIVGNVSSVNASNGTGVTGLSFSSSNGMYVNGLNSASRDLNDYFQYTISPTSGNNLTVTQIQLTHSLSNYTGSSKLAVYYSLNSDFSSATQVGTDISMTGSTTTTLSSLSISVNNTQTLYVRVYGWALTTSTTTFRNKAVSISGTTIPAGNTAPSLSTPTSASITNTSATLGATITYNGGADPTASGMVYGTSASPTGNATATSPTIVSGTFTVPVSSLSPQTLYYYRGYATNSYGTGYSSDGTFRTLSNPPTAQASGLTGAATSNTALNISWTAATFPASGATTKGYVLLRATSPNTPSLSNGNGAAPAAGANTTIVSSTILEGATSQASASLSANTTYNYLLVPYCWDGTNAATYNYLTASAPTVSATTFSSASAVTVSDRTASSMNLSWSNGNGSGRIVVARATSSTSVTPTNGTTYAVNSNDITDGLNGSTGTGNIVVYKGTGTSTSVTGLSAGTQYQFYVYEYNAVPNYSTAAASSATYTLAAEPTTQASGVTFSSILATGFTINFAKGDGTNRIVLVKSGSAVDAIPADATTYTASTTFSSGQEIGTGTGNRVVYNGTGTSVTVTGLTANTTYYVAVFEFSGSGGNINYLTTSPATGNQITIVAAPSAPTNLTFSSVTYNSFTASFTAPGTTPAGYLVVRRKGAAVSETPTGGKEYTVGQSVGSVAANEVIYVGTSPWTNENQTGLTDNTTYYYAVYSYAGSGTQINYSATLTGSQTTAVIPSTTANAASSINSSGFTANWETVNGASGGYLLDVSTSSDFGTLTPNTLTEGFETGMPISGYNTGTYTLGSGAWSLVNGLRSTNPYFKTGSYGCQLGSSTGSITSPGLNGVTSVSFWGVRGSSSTSLVVKKIVSGISTDLQTITLTNTMTQYTISVNDNSSNVQIQFLNSGSSVGYIDDVSIGYSSLTPSFVTGYDSKSIAGQSTTNTNVTGLSPNTTYYYRVRAVGEKSTSANSNVISVTTLKNTFTGTGDWSTPENWSAGTVPVSTDEVVIDGDATIGSNLEINGVTVNSGKSLTVNADKQLTMNGAFTNNGTFTLQSGATAITNGTVSGTGTTNVNQYLSSARNWYMSSPVTSTVLPTASTGTLTLYSYPEADANQATSGTSPIAWTAGNYWVTPSESNFIAGKGYIVAPSAATATVTFTGALNNGTVSSGTLTRTAANPKAGFNLVGNPYPSAVNVRTVINNTAALEKSIWYRTRNASNKYVFETYNTTTGIGTLNNIADGKITGTVPPMQSFWVRVAAENTSASFNFENSMRSHLTANPDTLNSFKVKAMESGNKILRLSIANEVVKDEAILYFNANASDSYDTYDSEKWLNNGTTVPNLYTTVGSEQLVINGMNAIPYDVEIPLTVQANAGAYTIAVSEFSNFAADENVQLIDKIEGTTDLINGNHVFSITNGENTTGRFSIIFRSPGSTTGVDTNNDNGISVYSIKNGINITLNSGLNENASVRVFNAVGQQLVNQHLNNRATMVKGNFTPGVYVVKVSNGTTATSTQKIVIK